MKVLITGDSPFLKTGFGKVNAIAAKTFADAGYDIGIVSGLSMDPVPDDLGYKMYYPDQGDVIGVLKANEAIYDFKPDLVYHTGEPGTLSGFARVIPARIPFFSYTPIEGEPIVIQEWRDFLGGLPIITCSQYGADILKKYCGVDDPVWAYHGIDHNAFRVNGRREIVRKALGWSDKFVIMTVAANVRRKQHPRLFEAISILKHKYSQKDILLYDHTLPFDNHWLDGWNLPEIAEAFHVHDMVQFNPYLKLSNDYIADVGIFDTIGLADLYNAADLFVLPSQVEGFGLPIAEAMACGVPVMVTKYAAGWEIAKPAGVGIPVIDWETHKSGTRYANVDIEAMAKEILRLKRNPSERARRSALGLRRVQDFRWEDFQGKLIETSQKLISSFSKAQEFKDSIDNKGRQEQTWDDSGRSAEIEESIQSQKADTSTANT